MASFIPWIKVELELSIHIDSHLIKGSPFPIYVREVRDYIYQPLDRLSEKVWHIISAMLIGCTSHVDGNGDA